MRFVGVLVGLHELCSMYSPRVSGSWSLQQVSYLLVVRWMRWGQPARVSPVPVLLKGVAELTEVM